MRFQPSGRDRHHRLPLQLLGHRPVSQPAPAGRQLVDPRHEQFLAFRIAEHPHGAAEPSAALEVMVHRRALLLLAVTPLPFPTSGRHAGALLLQPLPVPHPQGFLAGIPKLMDRIRGATLVSDIQVHRPIPLLPAIRHDNALLDSTSPKKTSPPHAEHFYLITYTRGRARRRPGAVQPKRPLAMRTQAMPATCSRSGRPASNPRPTRPGPPPAPLRRSGGDGRPAAAHAADSRFPHDVHHPAAADPGRIPALRRRPGARLAAPVHGHEGTGMGLEDAAGRRLAPGGHAAAACPDPGPSAAWRDEPAARRAGRRPAGWPDPEMVPDVCVQLVVAGLVTMIFRV